MDGTTANPTLQDYLTLFIDAGFTTANTLVTAFLALVPTLIQAIVNLVVGAFYAANPVS
jgi:hypothetical protein